MSSIKSANLPRVLTAVVTPFTQGGEIDLVGYETVIRHSINSGLGVILFGTTGETSTINFNEKVNLLSFIQGLGLPNDLIVIGVGGNDTKECIQMATQAVARSFTNIMITTPYYNKPNQEGVYRHFVAIDEAFNKVCKGGNIILYNVPPRTNVNILPETVKRVFTSCKNVVAIKEASGDLNQMIQIRHLVPDIILYSGDDGLVIPVMAVGGYGVISVLSNAYPKEVKQIVDRCVISRYEEAFSMHNKFHKMIKLIFSEPNPTPIKFVLNQIGVIRTLTVRLPLVEIQDEKLITQLLQQIVEIESYLNDSHCFAKEITELDEIDFDFAN